MSLYSSRMRVLLCNTAALDFLILHIISQLLQKVEGNLQK